MRTPAWSNEASAEDLQSGAIPGACGLSITDRHDSTGRATLNHEIESNGCQVVGHVARNPTWIGQILGGALLDVRVPPQDADVMQERLSNRLLLQATADARDTETSSKMGREKRVLGGTKP